ncbi:hypothetical protein CBW57_17840 [Yersinia intermedia]|uniref:Uncharacterized protein n=1 Tax=Yersinia intermedia TaxID=631 RepID=A0A208ZUH8_YERIN|nr:hypothetical protein CBW57_17840 [Yersinia intermedia]
MLFYQKSHEQWFLHQQGFQGNLNTTASSPVVHPDIVHDCVVGGSYISEKTGNLVKDTLEEIDKNNVKK